MRTFKRGVVFTVLSMFLLVPSLQASEADSLLLVNKATLTIASFTGDQNSAFFKKTAKDAKAILIIPQSIKGAFLVGGSGGSGVLLARNSETGEWGYPAFYTLAALSVGLQIGGESSEIMLMIMTERGMEKLLTSSFKLGADTSVAVGPVGAGMAAKTADVYSYSISKGAFVGASLDGAVIKTRDKLNAAFYGKEVSPTDIIIRKTVSNTQADPLRMALSEFAGQ
ncbi:MAG: lipid-binding SYLF domain-containing protein [Desulfopila sp.]|jgi:lipid-binding SYLF domain-containing protein|nr:lipid-binding SYLF domain-containing protein [Desulfopila sp.]